MVAMGIGRVGQPGITFKRKFRWTFELNTPVGNVPMHFVKTAGRPSLRIDKTQVDFLNARVWFPGKGEWQSINITYLDVAHQEMQSLYNWMATIYDFTAPANLKQSDKTGWNGVGVLTMYDGCGQPLERWILGSVFPESIDFGDLDYTSSDFADIKMTLSYSEVTYQGLCGPSPAPTCVGCS